VLAEPVVLDPVAVPAEPVPVGAGAALADDAGLVLPLVPA
jgi:hypothetical protein